jgi:hypothetical protein
MQKMKRRGGRQVEKCRAGYQSGTNLLILLLAGRERMKRAAAGWGRRMKRATAPAGRTRRGVHCSSMEEQRRRLLLLQASADWGKMATARRRPLLAMACRHPFFLFSYRSSLFLFLVDRFLLMHRVRAFSTPHARFFPTSHPCAPSRPWAARFSLA